MASPDNCGSIGADVWQIFYNKYFITSFKLIFCGNLDHSISDKINRNNSGSNRKKPENEA